MSITSAVLISLGICVVSALLEGIGAGRDVKDFFAKLRSPRLAPPVWVWYIIGVIYYVVCFFLAYRILRYEGQDTGSIKYISLALLLAFMGINAFWNFIFFRLRSMFLAFLLNLLYIPVAIALFISLWQFDASAAFVFLPYLIYLNYATWLGYQYWKLNDKF